MTVGWQRPAGRFALTAAVLHTAAVGVWLGVVLPARPVAAVEPDHAAGRAGELGQPGQQVGGEVGQAFLVLSERYPRDRPLGAGPPQAASARAGSPAGPAGSWATR